MLTQPTTVLLILDGWGMMDPAKKNAVITPKTAPHYFRWLTHFPHTSLAASGEAVGVFDGQEGNSEAGHLNLGAGRVVKQDALYISESVADGTFFKNTAFQQAVQHAKQYGAAAHIVGLLSNHNSAHACPEHLYALLDLLNQEGIGRVYLHLFSDGRDAGQYDALHHLALLKARFHGTEEVVSIMGRYYGMDRNKNWDRTKLAYEAIALGEAAYMAETPEAALEAAYIRGESDEFVSPTIIQSAQKKAVHIEDNDVVFFYNLRSDRARQFSKTLVQTDFERMNPGSFKRTYVPKNIRFVAMTDFGPDLGGVLTAFPSRDVINGLVATLCPRTQLYVAESEKFAHITYFFNGGYAEPLCREERLKIESDRIMSYADKPEMKTKEVANAVIAGIQSGKYEFIAANFAAPDMVGHTGNLAAAVQAVACIDEQLQHIIDEVLACNAQAIITADHGNVEEMINAGTGEVDTEHSREPVPFIVVASKKHYEMWGIEPGEELKEGKLANVAPTILKMMHIKKPKEMTAKSLF